MTTARADYLDALDRLRAAQRRYEALQDPRADWQHVRDAVRDVLVTRADIESIRRRSARDGKPID